jgi:hypothetical protein
MRASLLQVSKISGRFTSLLSGRNTVPGLIANVVDERQATMPVAAMPAPQPP